MPDVFEGNVIPDPSQKPEPTEKPETGAPSSGGAEVPIEVPAEPGANHVQTAFARGVGSSADTDGTHHDAAAPGEGEGTGIGESGG